MPRPPIHLKSHAKINIFLDVVGIMPDGYHELRTLFAPLALHDTITIDKAHAGITISCDNAAVPLDSANLAYRAAELFFEHTSVNAGVSIAIEKNIPVAAGLGGGSSNAAATLIGLDALFFTGLNKHELHAMAKAIGADVPFFIESKPRLAAGIGDEFIAEVALPEAHILLVNPGFEVSAGWAYSSLESTGGTGHKERLTEPLKNPAGLAEMLHNSLEAPVTKAHPVINDIKRELNALGALGALMSGSGPTVFGVFDTKEKARIAADGLRSLFSDFWVALTRLKE